MRMPFLLSLKLCFKDCHKFGQDYHTHKVNLNFVGEKLKKKKILIIILVVVLLGIIISTIVLLTSCRDNIKKESENLTNYTLNLNFDDGSKTLTGEETVDFINPYDVTLKKLEFHLYPNAFRQDATYRPVNNTNYNRAYPNGFSEGNITINNVSVDGVEKEVVIGGTDQNILEVELSEELFPEDRVSVSISFSVLLPNVNHRFGYGLNTYNFGNFYPILCIYEDGEFCEVNYGANGDPFYSNMANYDVNITYDDDFTLASTGVQNETLTSEGSKTTSITAQVVRDFAFVLSRNFSVISKKTGNTTVYYYYYEDDNAKTSLQAGVDAINTFNNLFGEYPYSTYSIVKTNFVHGGMEYPNLVYISDDVEDYKDYLNVIIHETAHQWWYNLVGSNACEYAWMDEGLTEYSTLMFYRENPSYEVDIQEVLNASLSSYILFSEIYESVYGEFDGVMSKNVNDFTGEMAYVYVTYVKGELFFNTLEEVLGEKVFLKGLKQYFNEYKFKIATPDDMVSCFEMVSKRDLEGFFDSWIEGKVILQSYE